MQINKKKRKAMCIFNEYTYILVMLSSEIFYWIEIASKKKKKICILSPYSVKLKWLEESCRLIGLKEYCSLKNIFGILKSNYFNSNYFRIHID